MAAGSGAALHICQRPGLRSARSFSLCLTLCEFTLRRLGKPNPPTENRSSAPPPRLPALAKPSRVSVGKGVSLRRLALRDEHVSVLLPGGASGNVPRSCRRLQEEV